MAVQIQLPYMYIYMMTVGCIAAAAGCILCLFHLSSSIQTIHMMHVGRILALYSTYYYIATIYVATFTSSTLYSFIQQIHVSYLYNLYHYLQYSIVQYSTLQLANMYNWHHLTEPFRLVDIEMVKKLLRHDSTSEKRPKIFYSKLNLYSWIAIHQFCFLHPNHYRVWELSHIQLRLNNEGDRKNDLKSSRTSIRNTGKQFHSSTNVGQT